MFPQMLYAIVIHPGTGELISGAYCPPEVTRDRSAIAAVETDRCRFEQIWVLSKLDFVDAIVVGDFPPSMSGDALSGMPKSAQSFFPGETVNVRCSKSLYDLLEVNESASHEAIAASYKRLHAIHSNLATNGEEDATNQLIAIREAYGTLSDQERRRRYDEKLATRLEAVEPYDKPRQSFMKLLIFVAVVGLLGLGYGKYQSEQEKARLERERIVAATKAAELEAQKAREEKAAADQADRQRRADEAVERNERARDIAYGNQVSRSVQYGEAQLRLEQQRAEQQRANEERQRVNEANRQLAKDKAYLRELEANSRRTNF